MRAISVGKNVVKILGHEFPVDSDLSLVKFSTDSCMWRANTARKGHLFVPIQNEQVTVETFKEYDQAFSRSSAFNSRGNLRSLFDRKEEGVKIIPGHGVFILPAKMMAMKSGHRNVKIKVFAGTSLQKVFREDNNEHLVEVASDYYYANLHQFTDSINEDLFLPVKYRRTEERIFKGIVVPEGVQAYSRHANGDEVYYRSPEKDNSVYLGTAKSMAELKRMFKEAVAIRKEEGKAKAMYRFVTPSFVSLSSYMRRL